MIALHEQLGTEKLGTENRMVSFLINRELKTGWVSFLNNRELKKPAGNILPVFYGRL